MSDKPTWNMKEACEFTGLSERSMLRYIKAGVFCAAMPRGRKGGWMIFSESLRQWWSGHIGKTSNRRVVA